MPQTPDPASVREAFIEKVGLISQQDGMPRIAGRVFGLLLFDGGSVSFSDLAERLQVSRGSISSATRLLQQRGLVKRIAKPGHRHDFFQLADHPFAEMLDTVVEGLQRSKAEVDSTISLLNDQQEATRKRLESYSNFYAVLRKAAIGAANDLR